MSRVINPDSAGKQRNQHMRSCAEMLRHLSQKEKIDDEARDMLATIVIMLREIDDGLEVAVEAWEKRDFYMKAEQLRQKWAWVSANADKLNAHIRAEQWDKIPEALVKMMPNFAEIEITTFTRKPKVWEGNYQRLLEAQS